jgi:hypothetical protein
MSKERKRGIRVGVTEQSLVTLTCSNGESETTVPMTPDRAKELCRTIQSHADKAQAEKRHKNRDNDE